jgi:23S rRNA (pseudouridine1915-N3)-methyltransferase
MKIKCIAIGKDHELYVQEGVKIFSKRITHYFDFEWQLLLPKINKTQPIEIQKTEEGKAILSKITKDDHLVLLDEVGKNLSSIQLAAQIEKTTASTAKNLIFVIGGAYGVSNEVQKRANVTWSLSNLVFPHQLVRLIVAEQIYRACTIIKNEKYHHV